MAITENKRVVGPLIIDGSGARCTIEYDIAAGDLDDLLDERFAPDYVPHMGLSVSKRRTHPRWNWMVLTSLAAKQQPPAEAVGGTDAWTANPTSGWAITETFKGEHLGGGMPAYVPIYAATGEWVDWDTQPTTQIRTLPTGNLVYDDGDPMAGDAKPGIVESHILHTLTWRNARALRETVIQSVAGKVNSAAKYLYITDPNTPSHAFNLTPAAEVLLFHTWDFEAFYDENNILLYDITYEFDEIATSFELLAGGSSWVTWNMAPRLQDGKEEWQDIVIQNTARGPYDTADFSVLIPALQQP